MNTAMVAFVIRMMSAQFGTYDRAMALADSCETPSAWVERSTDNNGAPHWIAVCGTADGRVCGSDVPWTHPDCQESESWQDTADDPERVEHACRVAATDYSPDECDGLAAHLRALLDVIPASGECDEY